MRHEICGPRSFTWSASPDLTFKSVRRLSSPTSGFFSASVIRWRSSVSWGTR